MQDTKNQQFTASKPDPIEEMKLAVEEPEDSRNPKGTDASQMKAETEKPQEKVERPSQAGDYPASPPPPPPRRKQGIFGKIFKPAKPAGAVAQNTAPAPPAPKTPEATEKRQIAPAPLPVGQAAIIKRTHARFKAILLVIAGLIFVSTAVFFIFFYRAQFNLNPSGGADQIIVDGKLVAAGVHKVAPGKHSIEIKKEGYVTFRQSREYKINERVNISLSLIKATEPELVEQGGGRVMQANTTRFVFIMLSDGRIASVASEPAAGEIKAYPLTNGSYQSARKILFSDDNSYAIILDTSEVKVVSFSRSDALNQTEGKLALDGQKINSITWNTGMSDYVAEPNSKLIYDVRGATSWDMMQSDVDLTKSAILMRIDPNRFSDPSIDWAGSQKTVLIVGGEAGAFDIASRSYTKLGDGTNYRWGGWGPNGKYAIVLDAEGESYLLKDTTLSKIGLRTTPYLISWVSPEKAIIVSEGRPVSVDFDNDARINYAEINGLKDADSAVVQQGRIFFSDKAGVKSAPLTENIYKINQAK